MESTNIPQDFHQEQEQKQQVETASSSSFQSSTLHGSWHNGASRYGSSQYAWSPNNDPFINNVGSRIHPNFNTQLLNTSRPYTGEKDEDEEIQIPWRINTEYDHHQRQTLVAIPDQSSNKSKLDLFSAFMFPKITDMISSSHSSVEDLQHLSPTAYLKTDNFQDTTSLTTNPALLTPSGQPQFQAAVQFQSNSHDYSGYEGSSISLPLMPSRGTFSQIFPSVNISNLNSTHLNSMVSLTSPLDMNVQALDLLTSARFGGGISHDQTQQSHALGQQHLQLSARGPTSSPDKTPSNVRGGPTTFTKRPQTEPRTTKTSSKKSRTESRACAPFKVRKEKLGDRIAALQQLVAPFGKTDTASVLMEAIGYIKFLQNQVETLSVPYMKASRPCSVKPASMVDRMGIADHGNVESRRDRRDMRSRGLCLVPLSCMSYVTNDDGGSWPSSDYHGGT